MFRKSLFAAVAAIPLILSSMSGPASALNLGSGGASANGGDGGNGGSGSQSQSNGGPSANNTSGNIGGSGGLVNNTGSVLSGNNVGSGNNVQIGGNGGNGGNGGDGGITVVDSHGSYDPKPPHNPRPFLQPTETPDGVTRCANARRPLPTVDPRWQCGFFRTR